MAWDVAQNACLACMSTEFDAEHYMKLDVVIHAITSAALQVRVIAIYLSFH